MNNVSTPPGEAGPSPIELPRKHSVSSATRDRFLSALDADDKAELRSLNTFLAGCTNPLPIATCERLGLVHGSTYGDAVQVIERARLDAVNAAVAAGKSTP